VRDLIRTIDTNALLDGIRRRCYCTVYYPVCQCMSNPGWRRYAMEYDSLARLGSYGGVNIPNALFGANSYLRPSIPLALPLLPPTMQAYSTYQ
jgi:hypothetical protein